MIVHAYMHDAIFVLKDGSRRKFTPQGVVHHVRLDTRAIAQEDVERLGGGSRAARLFVGLKVGTKTKFTIQDVIQETVRVRRDQGASKDASFLAQMGTYEDRRGRLIVEPSAQIVILDFAGMPKKTFTKQMTDLGESLRAKFKQESVIVEIQESGVVKDVFTVRE